ncbi:MAG: hypothetical protein K940chlam8_00644 [Chlamydiae bacterium]|nr:hypothetical protein [Chlamydiota bacterium]
MKKLMIMCLSFALGFAAQQDMPEPYRSINVLPFDGHGWFASANQRNLQRFIATKDPKVIVELGSWLGTSTRFMAKLIADDAVVYAVDHWLGNIQIDHQPQHAKKYPELFQLFLSNVIHENLTHKIVPVRMKTSEAAKALNVKADLIYIDAAHEEESVFTDIMDWFPKLKEDGIMCGDDWTWDSVRKAVFRANEQLHLKVCHEGNFWWFE